MKIELNLPPGQRQREFLDYLNSALRIRMSSYEGSAGVNEAGLFESAVTGPFSLGQEAVHLSWRIFRDRRGTLLYITIEAAGHQVAEETWGTAAREFITSVLATALAEKRTEYFRRSVFFYVGPQLDGEYWLPGYRFAPVYPTDPEPYLINAERPVSIDQVVPAIDEMHAFALADERSRRHAARLSLLLNTALYPTEHTKRWVWPVIEGKPAAESVRYHLGFVHPSVNLVQMPKKGEQCNLGGYKGSLAARYRVAGELLSLPSAARRILRGIDNTPPQISDAFDRGARLYQVATVCGRFFPSVGLAYRVAAVEAVCQADQTCKGFSDFMRRHVHSQKNLDEVLEYLYGVARSAHFHGGEFPMGEFDRHSLFSPFMDADTVQRDALHRTCYEVTREAIVNWLGLVVPEMAGDDSYVTGA